MKGTGPGAISQKYSTGFNSWPWDVVWKVPVMCSQADTMWPLPGCKGCTTPHKCCHGGFKEECEGQGAISHSLATGSKSWALGSCVGL